MHRTKHSEGDQPTLKGNSEERYQRLKPPECLPEITLGAFYVEEISEYEDISSEDENNNFLIDPDVIDLTRDEINLEAMGMKKINGETIWNDHVKEPSYRYLTTIREDPPIIKIINVRGGNGEE